MPTIAGGKARGTICSATRTRLARSRLTPSSLASRVFIPDASRRISVIRCFSLSRLRMAAPCRPTTGQTNDGTKDNTLCGEDEGDNEIVIEKQPRSSRHQQM